MARVGGVGADERGGGFVERFRGVGLFHRVIADGVRIELALDDCCAGWRFSKKIGPTVARAANANGGDSGGGEDVADEPLIIGAGTNRREIAAFFNGAASGGGLLLRGECGAEMRRRFGATPCRFCRVNRRVRRELPRLLG